MPAGTPTRAIPLACAAAVATINAMKDERIVENAAWIGENVLGPGLRELAGKHACVGEVRGLGVFWALDLVKDKATREPIAPYGGTSPAMADLIRACKERGLLPFSQFNRLHAVPPCNVSEAEATGGDSDPGRGAYRRRTRTAPGNEVGRSGSRSSSSSRSAQLPAQAAARARAGRVTITLYNGQHVETTDTLVAAFEKATGIKVAVRSNDEDIFDARDRRRGRPVAGRRRSSRRIRPRSSTCRKRAFSPGSITRRSPARRAGSTRPQGDWVGVSARVSVLIYNPSLIRKERPPDPRPRARRPSLQG